MALRLLFLQMKSLTEECKMAEKKHDSKRELIDTGADKRYVRRDDKGRFDEVEDVGRSLSQDVRKHAKTTVKPGQGDRGDQKPNGG
jgi:hypothetical protein